MTPSTNKPSAEERILEEIVMDIKISYLSEDPCPWMESDNIKIRKRYKKLLKSYRKEVLAEVETEIKKNMSE